MDRLSERQFQAHRLHQTRVASGLTMKEAAKRAGMSEEAWKEIEYGVGGKVEQVKRLIGNLQGPRREGCR